MYLTIDRIEGDMAVLIADNRKIYNFPSELFPEAHEGNIYKICMDFDETRRRKERLQKLAGEVWE